MGNKDTFKVKIIILFLIFCYSSCYSVYKNQNISKLPETVKFNEDMGIWPCSLILYAKIIKSEDIRDTKPWISTPVWVVEFEILEIVKGNYTHNYIGYTEVIYNNSKFPELTHKEAINKKVIIGFSSNNKGKYILEKIYWLEEK